MERRQNNHRSIISNNNDSGDQHIPSRDTLFRTLSNPGNIVRRMTSWGFNLRQTVSTRRSMGIVPDPSIRQLFQDLFNEPISEQHQRHFCRYFREDIGAKTFTINEFGLMFNVKAMLSERLLMVFNLKSAYEANSILGSDIIRIARILWNSPMSVKAFILFKLFDNNGDDIISIDEIRLFYENYSSEFKIFRDQEHQKEVVDIFLQGFFPINDNTQQQGLNFDQFYNIIQRNPDVVKSLYLISIPDQDKEDVKEIPWHQRWSMYMKTNAKRLVFLFLYILTLISLGTYVCVDQIVILKNSSVWLVIARIGGMGIKFNYAVAVSLMLKQIMTIIRRIRYLRLIIPVDDHIDAHRLVGTVLSVSAMIHTLGYLIQYATHTAVNSWAESEFTTDAHAGWVDYSAPITGNILLVLLMIMFICSLQCIRQRSGCYWLFHYTHYLFWPIFILLVIHSVEFWKWAIGPTTLLVMEKIYSLKRYLPTHGRTRLRSVRFEDQKVVTFIIERPAHFTFRTGNYINICFPNIAKMEWRPFSIASAPGRKDILRLSIMKKRNWTRKVYDHFYQRLTNLNDPTDLTEITTDHSDSNSRNISLPKEITFGAEDQDAAVWIEGPFSTCTSYIFDYEHVVLIGAGIGATPSISAIESLIHRLQAERCVCSNCHAVNYNHARLANQKLKKVDFIWVNREVGNFSWFRNILDEFENEQETYLKAIASTTNDSQEKPSRYLDIHLYCTSLRSNDQAMLENLPHDLVANMYAAIQQQDMYTKLKTPTHVGRPPWKLLFSKFKAEYKSTSVFFTGNSMMAGEIKRYCDELDFSFQHEPEF